ncbi:MAG: hypothetical protein JSS00_01045 [Proteobacteria bacterium]|nr:hypothetical protein [Pseudomonadota bacterium]
MGAQMVIQPDTETLLAVVLGAALATAGGFSERQFERLVQRREKERSAALLFGELLNAMRLIVTLAGEARGRGDPYGPITLRFVRGARREVEIYDRNRETLLDLRDPNVRARISVLVARLSFSLDGVLDAHGEIAAAEPNLRTLPADDPSRAEIEAHLAMCKESRRTAFDFALESSREITPLLEQLAPLARQNFGIAEAVVREQ